MKIKLGIYIFLPLFWTIFIVDGGNVNMEPKHFCDNPYHFDKFVLQDMNMCFCEPYDPKYMDGQPSIVRFPVKLHILKVS